MPMVSPSRRSDHSEGRQPQPFRQLDQAALEQNADELLASIQQGSRYWKWPEWPERPENLQTDQELWTAYRRQERGEKISREDREQLALLASWRSAIRKIETRTVTSLQTMCGCLWTLENAVRIEEGEPPRYTRGEDADRLREHIRQQFRALLPNPVPEPGSAWVRGWCLRFGRNWELLPLHLRSMKRPPADKGWLNERQQGLGYAED